MGCTHDIAIHSYAEFWMKVPWSEAEAMICYTHVNAKKVRMATS